jgi:hypothetical protein
VDGGGTLAHGSVIRPLADIPLALPDRHRRIKIDLERARSTTRSNSDTQSSGWRLGADHVVARVLEVVVAVDFTGRQQIIDAMRSAY